MEALADFAAALDEADAAQREQLAARTRVVEALAGFAAAALDEADAAKLEQLAARARAFDALE